MNIFYEFLTMFGDDVAIAVAPFLLSKEERIAELTRICKEQKEAGHISAARRTSWNLPEPDQSRLQKKLGL